MYVPPCTLVQQAKVRYLLPATHFLDQDAQDAPRLVACLGKWVASRTCHTQGRLGCQGCDGITSEGPLNSCSALLLRKVPDKQNFRNLNSFKGASLFIFFVFQNLAH